jgi:hypothetical protein
MTTPVKLHMNIKITPEGVMIGQCEEFPAVIVQAESKYELVKEMKDGVMGLYEVFPKEFETMAKQHAIRNVIKGMPKMTPIKTDKELLTVILPN